MQKHFAIRPGLLSFIFLASSPQVWAQQAPSAGSQLQQIPPAPVLQQQPLPAIRLESATRLDAPTQEGAKITVRVLRITGARLFTPDELVAWTGFERGSDLSLAQLREMAAHITSRYRAAGYIMARAYLPAQEITDGVVTIAVTEGRYGQIATRNRSHLSDGLLTGILMGIEPGDAVAIGMLENRLLLLSDIPGVTVASTLAPGATPGSSDLTVDVAPGRRVSGSIDADNAGNRYTGIYRIGATVNLNNPAGLGDVASLRVLSSGSGLSYVRPSYQIQMGRATIGAAYSWLHYELGREFASLGASGTARVASLYGSYPLIRSRNANLYAGLGLDAKRYSDRSRLDLDMPVANKTARVMTASLRGDHRDTLGAGGVSSYAVAWGTGSVDLRTAELALRHAPSQSSGHFDKFTFSALRLQGLTDSVSLFAGINGQFASRNLDVSEKMALGGMYGVRAYPEGETYADRGYVLTLETRLRLPRFSAEQRGQLQLIGFFDTASATLNKNPWLAGDNRRTLSGAGVGVSWSKTNDFMLRAFYARKVGNEPALSAPDRSGRLWVQAVKFL
jgi:hemolysin activation/secretion protein